MTEAFYTTPQYSKHVYRIVRAQAECARAILGNAQEVADVCQLLATMVEENVRLGARSDRGDRLSLVQGDVVQRGHPFVITLVPKVVASAAHSSNVVSCRQAVAKMTHNSEEAVLTSLQVQLWRARNLPLHLHRLEIAICVKCVAEAIQYHNKNILRCGDDTGMLSHGGTLCLSASFLAKIATTIAIIMFDCLGLSQAVEQLLQAHRCLHLLLSEGSIELGARAEEWQSQSCVCDNVHLEAP